MYKILNANQYLERLYELLGVSEEYTTSIGVDSLLSEILSAFSEGRGNLGEFCAYLIGGVVLIGLCSLFTSNKYLQASSAFVVTFGIFKTVRTVFIEISDSLGELSRIFSGLIPIMSGLTLAGGGVSSSKAEALTMGLTLNVLLGICVPVLIPLSAVVLGFSVISPFDSGASFKKIRSAFLSLMALATAVLLGSLSLTSIISIGKDSALMRTAKYSVSSLIPIVGSAVSSSLSALGAGLSYAKSIIGATSIYALATVALSPLLMLLCYRFLLSIAASVTERLSGAASGGFSAISAAIDGIIAVYTLSLVVIIFEIILFMKSGVFIA